MDPNTLILWEGLITMAAAMGVKSYNVIKAMLQDAGADDATITALQPKWDTLTNDIRRASM